MYSTKNYSISKIKKTALCFIVLALLFAVYHIALGKCEAEQDSKLITVWALCKPGSFVEVRETPSKQGHHIGYLDPCDSFQTDGVSKNGYIHAVGLGDSGDSWVYSGFVSTEKPDPVFERYVCSSISRVACRRWISGPRVTNYGWITNGSNVQVFYRTETWCVTNRGYIQSQYLEADPE